jgi:addiction module HigA family antidote
MPAIARDNTAFILTINIESASSGRKEPPHMTSKSSTTTRKKNAARESLLPLITPGEFLSEEFLEPLGLSANALALALRVPANRIQAIVNGQRAITADTALRLRQLVGPPGF